MISGEVLLSGSSAGRVGVEKMLFPLTLLLASLKKVSGQPSLTSESSIILCKIGKIIQVYLSCWDN